MPPPIKIDQALGDRKPETRSRRPDAASKGALFEGFKDALTDNGGNSIATVSHLETDHVALHEGDHFDLSTLGEFRSIAHEIEEDLFYAAHVCDDISGGFRLHRETGLYRLALRQDRRCFNQLLHQFLE